MRFAWANHLRLGFAGGNDERQGLLTLDRRRKRTGGVRAAETAFASCFEQWKKRGRTSAQFWGVITFASSTTAVMHRRPSRRGSTISGKRCTRSAAVLRKYEAAFESPSSRLRNGKSPLYPSSSHRRFASKSASASRKSAMAARSWRSRPASRFVRSRAFVMRAIIAGDF
jgi:hypothetical protein